MALQEDLEKQGNWLFKYRSYVPLSILSVGTILYVYTELHPKTFILKGTSYERYYEMLALGISLAGQFIRIYTVGHTPRNTSGRNTKQGQVADSLNTTGLYSVVRHPLYLGNFLMWLGPAMLPGNIWFLIIFCLLYWIYYERIMFAEEQFLRAKFGQPYLDWANGRPAFIPRFKNFFQPNMPFSWKKVLKNEKNGVFALFLIFSTLDILGELIRGETNYNYFLIIMAGLTGLSYVILKYLKKRTNFLNEPDR